MVAADEDARVSGGIEWQRCECAEDSECDLAVLGYVNGARGDGRQC